MNNTFRLPNPLRVAVYARFGTAPDACPVRVYSDEKTLMQACRAGQIDQLIVESFTRLGRNTDDALRVFRELRSAGVTVNLQREGLVM